MLVEFDSSTLFTKLVILSPPNKRDRYLVYRRSRYALERLIAQLENWCEVPF